MKMEMKQLEAAEQVIDKFVSSMKTRRPARAELYK